MSSIVTFNARGIRARKKRRAIFRHLHINYPKSIISLQETHSSTPDEKTWALEWGGDVYFSHGRENAGGVAFLFPPNQCFDVKMLYCGVEGRLLILEVSSDTREFTLVGIYAPSANRMEDKCRFLNRLEGQLRMIPNDHLVICGDMNIKLGDRDTSSSFQPTRASNKLRAIVEEFELIDAWRQRYPAKRKYTWRKTSPLQQCRLDYIFMSKSMFNGKQTNVRIDPGILSDHSFVFAEIDTRKTMRGPGIWRFKNSLLQEEQFRCEIQEEIGICSRRSSPYDGEINIGTKLEILLSKCRIIAIRRNGAIQKRQCKEEKELTETLKKLEQDLGTGDPNVVQNYEETKERLEHIKQRKGELAIIASGARWIEQGEKPSAYFLNLSKRRSSQKSIVALESNDGRLLSDKKEILSYCADFYKNMYKTRGVQADKMDVFKIGDNDPRLTEEEKMLCEAPISEEECLIALKGMASNKAPGVTGFTAEFYICFWDLIGGLVVKYVEEVYEKKAFFVNHVRGIIHLIPKNGDQTQLRNKRPICLVDVLYKIVAKVLALRLGARLSKIIHPDQTGFVKGRFIGENLRLVSDVIAHCNEEKQEGICLTVDFRNAFDTVERGFILYALKEFNFGDNFCGWIKTLYRGSQMSVMNDGYISEWFPCERGTFQGSPISGMLFLLAIELLASKIRRCQEVNGILINKVEVKVSLYADDMTLFLRDERSLEKCLSILQEFKEASGLEINVQKTKLMWIGALSHKNESFKQIKAVDQVKILGVYFSSQNNCYRMNIDKVIGNMEKITNAWNQRDITLKGRITVAKSLLISQIIYVASSYMIEKKDFITIQSHIMRFLWRGRPPKVAKKVMWQEISLGGLNAPCVEAIVRALRVTWVKRILTWHESTWRRLLQARIGEFDINNIFKTRSSNWALRRWNIPLFYQSAIIDFQKINEMTNCTGKNVRKVIMWYNDDILVDSVPVFYKSLYRAGVNCIGDITKPNGCFLSYEELREKYPQARVNPLTYQGLLAAIPGAWKNL